MRIATVAFDSRYVAGPATPLRDGSTLDAVPLIAGG